MAAAYDEVLVSTRPPGGPKWLNPHPMRWLDELGVPVTALVLGESMRRDRGVLKVRWDDDGSLSVAADGSGFGAWS